MHQNVVFILWTPTDHEGADSNVIGLEFWFKFELGPHCASDAAGQEGEVLAPVSSKHLHRDEQTYKGVFSLAHVMEFCYPLK